MSSQKKHHVIGLESGGMTAGNEKLWELRVLDVFLHVDSQMASKTPFSLVHPCRLERCWLDWSFFSRKHYREGFSQSSAVNLKGTMVKGERTGRESYCYKATAWVKSSISVFHLLNSQGAEIFPSAFCCSGSSSHAQWTTNVPYKALNSGCHLQIRKSSKRSLSFYAGLPRCYFVSRVTSKVRD